MQMNRLSWVTGALLILGLVGCGDDDSPGGPTDAAPDGGTGGDAGATLDAGAGGPRPISIGPGYGPAVAVDPAGTGYIAWVGPESTTTSLNFCRLPRGAQACAASAKVTAPGTSLHRPFVAVNGATVQLLSYRYGIEPGGTSGIYLFTSRDSGGSFEPGKKVGTTDFSAAAQAADGSVSVTTHAVSTGLAFQTVSLADAAPAATTEALLSTTHPYTGAVGYLDGLTPVVVYANGASDMQLRRWLGSGDRHDAATWSAPVELGKGDRLRLAGGSKGLFLLAQVPTGGLQVRRYEGGTFTAGTPIPDGTGELAHTDLLQDSRGRLHVLWPRIEASGVHLYRATSDDGGVVWKVALAAGDEGFAGVQAAMAPDQIGLAVWGTAASAGSSQVHVIAIGP